MAGPFGPTGGIGARWLPLGGPGAASAQQEAERHGREAGGLAQAGRNPKVSVHLENRKGGCIIRQRQPPWQGGRSQTPGSCCHPPGSVSAPLGHPCPSPATGRHARAQCSHRIKPLGACHLGPLRDGPMLQKKPSKPGLRGGWPRLAGAGRAIPMSWQRVWGAALAPRSAVRGDSPLVPRKVVIFGPSVLRLCLDSLTPAAEAQEPPVGHRRVEGQATCPEDPGLGMQRRPLAPGRVLGPWKEGCPHPGASCPPGANSRQPGL